MASLFSAMRVPPPLPRAFADQDDVRRLDQDDEIEKDSTILDVIEVVGKLLPRVFERGAVGIIDLRPAGDARLHRVALAEEGNLLRELIDEEWPLRPRADEAHIAA